MDDPIEYREMQPADRHGVSDFVTGVFNRFVAPEFSRQGVDEFMKYIQPDELAAYLRKNYFGIVALAGSQITGAILVRDNNHIALFFVAPQHQRKGIGRELLRRALEECGQRDAKFSRITVNSSPNAIAAYQKFRFTPTDKEQCMNGIRFVPMILRLQPEKNA